ncbi:MAG: TlpA family protein disulfide reductase [Firmicutes bacterium]|nr:TlpA family protein disulfide reductase [Bacillota bacterium]
MKRLLLIAVFCIVVIAASCIRIDPQDSGASKAEPSAAESTMESAAESSAEESVPYEGLVFHTADRDGNVWDQSVFMENSLTMINFWEPWCGPCVGEMPDLEKLAADYKDRGFVILGVYSTADMEKDVDQVLDYTGVTYPILHYCVDFDQFQTGYVPTTVFVDAEGKVLGEPYIGSRSYKEWAGIVEDLLNGKDGGNG